MKSKIKLNLVFFIAFCFFSYQKMFSQCSVPTVKSPIYYCLNSPSSALTATPTSGAILNWYTTVTGTLPSASAPTPSTALIGSQTYYVSQTVGSCESVRVAIVVNVIADTGAIATSFTCVPSQVTSPNSVYFDWNHVPGRSTNDYGYSYSIGGGPLVFGRTPLSSLEVFGVLPGQSVEFTILDVPGVPCYPTQSLTCDLPCKTIINPTFAAIAPICSGSTAPVLPLTSLNGIIGTWSPSIISNTTSGTYTFTPSVGQCATPASLTVFVTPNPILTGNQNICFGFTSTFSSTVAGGTWSSATTSIATVNSTTGVVTSVSPGTTLIAYTIKGMEGCLDVVTERPVTISPISNAGVISGNQNICVGSTSTFASTVAGGIWSSNNTSIATVNSSTGVVIGLSPGTTTISYNVQGTGGCPNTMVTLPLTVSQVAKPAFSSVPQICSGTVLSPLPATSLNGITGIWSPALNNTATTLYTFTPTLGQCAISTSLAVTVNPLPSATISGSATVCSGTAGIVTIFGTPNAIVTYTVNSGSNQTIILDAVGSAAILTPVLLANSVYNLVSITSAESNCSRPLTSSNVITVALTPTVTATPLTQSICSGETTNINLLSSPVTMFDWTAVQNGVIGALAGTGSSITQVLQTSGNLQGTVVYTIIPFANGCVGIPIKTTVTVNPLPLLEPMPNVIACSSYTLPQLLEGSYYTGVEGTGNSVPSGTTITTSTVLSVFVSNGFCSASYPHSITIIPEPKLEIVTENNSNEIYIDNTTVVQSLLLNSQLSGDYMFQWFENGIAIEGATNATYLVNTVSQNANPRNFTVSASKGICKTTSSVFEVNQTPVPAPSGNRLQSFTQGQTLADLEVEGSNIQWYADRTGNRNANSTPLPLTTVLVNGATYYASQIINGYESPTRLDVTVQVSLGNDSFTFKNLKFSPNPIVNVLTITSNEIFTKISIYNILGQEVHRQKGNGLEVKLELSHLVSGNYFVKVASDTKQQIIKVIKK